MKTTILDITSSFQSSPHHALKRVRHGAATKASSITKNWFAPTGNGLIVRPLPVPPLGPYGNLVIEAP
jgi:hypothetical protein